MKIVSMALLGLLLLGCSKEARVSQSRWTAGSGGEPPIPPKSVDVEKPQKVGKYRVLIGSEKKEGIPIEGTFFKSVDIQGKTVHVESLTAENISRRVIAQAQKMKVELEVLHGKAIAKHSELSRGEEGAKPKVVIIRDKFWQPAFVVERVWESQAKVFRFFFSADLQLLKKESLHFPFGEKAIGGRGTALDFKSRNVKKVPLAGLYGNGRLESLRMKVENGVRESAYSPKREFHFPTNSPHFDEVHVYYTIDFGMDWFKKHLSLELDAPLAVKVHIGRQRPANAAFYYNNKIRLGRGDGKIYQDMPKDQSIVLHELSHAYVEKLARLRNEKESGSINEGFADFFAASMLEHPKMAEYSYLKAPYKRNIENKNRAFDDFTGGKYHDSLAVSGTLWHLRSELGEMASLEIAVDVLVRLNPYSDFSQLKTVFGEVLASRPMSADERKKMKEVLQIRNWL